MPSRTNSRINLALRDAAAVAAADAPPDVWSRPAAWFRHGGVRGLEHYLTLLNAQAISLKSDVAVLHARASLCDIRMYSASYQNPVELAEPESEPPPAARGCGPAS